MQLGDDTAGRARLWRREWYYQRHRGYRRCVRRPCAYGWGRADVCCGNGNQPCQPVLRGGGRGGRRRDRLLARWNRHGSNSMTLKARALRLTPPATKTTIRSLGLLPLTNSINISQSHTRYCDRQHGRYCDHATTPGRKRLQLFHRHFGIRCGISRQLHRHHDPDYLDGCGDRTNGVRRCDRHGGRQRDCSERCRPGVSSCRSTTTLPGMPSWRLRRLPLQLSRTPLPLRWLGLDPRECGGLWPHC